MNGRLRIDRLVLSLSLAFPLVATTGIGQPQNGSDTPKISPKTYGTQDVSYYRVAATEILPAGTFDSSLGYGDDNDKLRFPTGGVIIGRFMGYAHLPAGALVTSFELDFCDEDANDDILATLLDCDYLGHCAATELVQVGSGGYPSPCGARIVSLPQVYIVNNFVKELLIQIDIPGGGSTGVAGVILGYKLQVSPPPGNATFADVPTTHLYFRAIEALADAGITQGCGGGNFCPNQAVTRGELAKLLANALGLHWN